jgi:hypothetical protein
MNHLQEFTVTFSSAVSRQVVEGSAIKKYYRNNFVIDGRSFSVPSPDKLTGQIGRVRFVKAGESTPTGGKVAQDAFTLIGAGSVEELRQVITVRALAAELAGAI